MPPKSRKPVKRKTSSRNGHKEHGRGSISMDISDPFDSDSDGSSLPTSSPPPSKRQKSQEINRRLSADSGDVRMREVPATLRAQQHHNLPRMATVHLAPLVVLDGGGRIEKVSISPQQRTPSPFGSRMGDHTVAWSAVVDAVRARIHGLPIEEAVQALGAAHADASAWMELEDSAGMRLFRMLPGDDQRNRTGPLEHWAWQTRRLLAEAVVASRNNDVTAAAVALQQAVAHHLAYLNYLPFATVPAESERGSKGDAEGRKRGRILEVEKAGTLHDAPLPPDAAEGSRLRGDLWGLFASDAAIRESGAWLLNPAELQIPRSEYQELDRLRTQLRTELDTVSTERLTRGQAKLNRQTNNGPLDIVQINRLADALAKNTKFKEIAKAGRTLARIAGRELGKDFLATLDKEMGVAAAVVATLEAQARDALPRVSFSLAHLLHDHQRTVATAYPRAVTRSGFLAPPEASEQVARDHAREAAASQLKKHLKTVLPAPKPQSGESAPSESDAMRDLLDAFAKDYAEIGSAPRQAERNTWTGDSSNEDLVVSYDRNAAIPLRVNGRADAPTGVTGMGSHSTAWVTERDAVIALVARERDEGAVLAALGRATLDDLASDVMRLDHLLPAAQLDAGQLQDIFNRAVEVLGATDVSGAATAYLRFRNLLPFATVDAGDRAGRGERSNGSAEKNFDRRSLLAEAALIRSNLKDPRTRAEAIGALGSAADELTNWAQGPVLQGLAGETADVVRRLAMDSVNRLETQAQKLRDKVVPEVVETVIGVREAEHRTVSELAGTLTSRA